MKYLSIYKFLKDCINSGKYEVGTSLPRTEALEKEFGVSRTAVLNALKMLVRDGLVRRMRSKGTYVTSKTGNLLSEDTRSERIVLLGKGSLFKIAANGFSIRTLNGLEDIFKKNKRSLHYVATDAISTKDQLTIVNAIKPGGICLFSVYDPGLLEGLKAMNVPVVCMDTVDQRNPFDQFTSDHQQAGILAVKKLFELGHRKILFFGNYSPIKKINDPDHEFWARNIQAEAALLQMKSVKPFFLDSVQPSDSKAAKIKEILEKHPDHTGLICATPGYLRMVKHILENTTSGSLHGFDGVTFTFPKDRDYLCERPVWQIRWNMREMGRQAATLLIQLMKGGPYKPTLHRMPVELD